MFPYSPAFRCPSCNGTGMETVSTGPFMMRSTCRWILCPVIQNCSMIKSWPCNALMIVTLTGGVKAKVLGTRILAPNAMVMVRPTIERRCFVQLWESLSKLIANKCSNNNLRCLCLCLLELRMVRQCGCRLETRKSSSPSSEQTSIYGFSDFHSFFSRVEKSDYFTRKGADVHTEAHISLAQVRKWKDLKSSVWVTYDEIQTVEFGWNMYTR